MVGVQNVTKNSFVGSPILTTPLYWEDAIEIIW